jgi:hypothetical protein
MLILDLSIDLRDAVGDRLHLSDQFVKDGVSQCSWTSLISRRTLRLVKQQPAGENSLYAQLTLDWYHPQILRPRKSSALPNDVPQTRRKPFLVSGDSSRGERSEGNKSNNPLTVRRTTRWITGRHAGFTGVSRSRRSLQTCTSPL